jgi:hypothetical protein
MDGEYKSECEECDNITVVLNVDSFDQPCFCSICGRRSDYERIDIDNE